MSEGGQGVGRRKVLHLDADAFFASVEQASDARLRGKPVAVGGEKRGIIASASYEARRFGIYTPMPTARARKLCPKLIIVPGDYEKYEQFSRWMFSYAYDFTPDVEVTSIDEGYLDVTGSRKSALEIAETLRRAIGQSLKLTVSEGIGSNKLVSQIASKLHKPAALAQVEAGEEVSFLHPLENHWLPGIGPKAAGQLDAAGLARVGQIAMTPLELLQLILGKQAVVIRQFANGVDERPVVPIRVSAKTYGQQETFGVDTTDEGYVEAVLRRMADELMAKAREEGHSVRTLTVKVRYNDMTEEQGGVSLEEPTDIETDVYGTLSGLLRQAWRRRVSLRLVSLKLSNLHARTMRVELPLDAGSKRAAARQRLAMAVDTLRRERGARVILRGHDFRLREGVTPYSVGGPSGEAGAREGSVETSDAKRKRTEDGADRQREVEVGVGGRGKRAAKTCVPLSARSYYSFLDSTLSIEALVAWAERMGSPAVALADQGNMHGVVELAQRCRAVGLKAIVGARVKIEGEWVGLHVENAVGYRNLCRIVTAHGTKGECGGGEREDLEEERMGEKGERRTTRGKRGVVRDWGLKWSEVEAFSEGLLAVGGGDGGAWGRGGIWWDRFPGRCYRAIANERDVRESGRRPGDSWVAYFPAHYESAMDRWKYDVVQSIRTLTLLRQEHPEKRLDGAFHLRAASELRDVERECPRALERTLEIAERCVFEMPFGAPQFPAFAPPDGMNASAYLRALVFEGLYRRYPGRHEAICGQVEEELGIIAEVGYEEYFLVMWDILQECRRRGIEWITRGSAADSLVCYCLGISGVCPVRFELYFRRFLNRDRMRLNKLPDIDIDFPHDRKDDVIDLVFEKYGAEHAAVVGGFSTYQARGAFGDVAKVLGISEYQVRRFTEHFPWTGSKGLAAKLEQSIECRELPMKEEPYATALRMAEFLDGFPRYAKMHPCGVVLSRGKMADLTPVFRSRKGYATTHYDMDAVEVMGLVKTDILAQGGLAVMRDVKRMLMERGVEVDLERCEVVG